VRIRSADREGLERLIRYILRPALAVERLEELPDGRIAYGFRKPRFDGATHVILKPLELMEKLAALVAPPRAHLVCYDGVLAPHSGERAKVVAGAHGPGRECRGPGGEALGPAPKRKDREKWAPLMRRTMGLDVLWCPRCGGRMDVIACITDPGLAERMLVAMKLPAGVPEVARSRPPPEDEFDFDQSTGEF